MKVTILCENQVGHRAAKICRGEWGFSALLEHEGIKILFDTGTTSLWKENAEALGIDLDDIDYIAFSHHHWDHTRGIVHHSFKPGKKVIIHPDLPDKLEKPVREVLDRDFSLVPSRGPRELAPGLFFMGEIPRKNSFERGMYKDDTMLDDTAFLLKTDRGCIVISGCAHSGICNICEEAKHISGQKIRSVLGGFHLMQGYHDLVEKTMDYMKAQSPESLYPLHCVDFEVQCLFHRTFKTEKLSTGDEIIFD